MHVFYVENKVVLWISRNGKHPPETGLASNDLHGFNNHSSSQQQELQRELATCVVHFTFPQPSGSIFIYHANNPIYNGLDEISLFTTCNISTWVSIDERKG